MTAVAAAVVRGAASFVRHGGRSPAPPAPLLAAGVVAPPPALPMGGDPASYVGFVYPQTASGDDYPLGVEHLGDGLVASGEGQFGWAHVRYDSHDMVWFQRFLDPVGAGRRVQVLDAVDVGSVGDGYRVLVGRCRYGTAKTDPEIAATVRFADEEAEPKQEGEHREADGDAEEATAGEERGLEFSSDISRAWRLNRKSGRIEPVDLEGLRCQSPGD